MLSRSTRRPQALLALLATTAMAAAGLATYIPTQYGAYASSAPEQSITENTEANTSTPDSTATEVTASLESAPNSGDSQGATDTSSASHTPEAATPADTPKADGTPTPDDTQAPVAPESPQAPAGTPEAQAGDTSATAPQTNSTGGISTPPAAIPFDTFSIVARVKGETEKIAPNTTFRVKLRWALPDRETIADYPYWTPPPNPVIMELPLNTVVPFPIGGKNAFPHGTELFLEAQLDATTPALPAGLKFGKTRWIEGGGKYTSEGLKHFSNVGPEDHVIELENEILADNAAPATPAPGATTEIPGFDTFSIIARLDGKTEQVSPDTKFRVAVHWTLPDRATVEDYPKWTPPPNPTIMEIPINKEVAFPLGGAAAFPNGTRITLETDLAGTTPALPKGLKFGQPTWKFKDEITGLSKFATHVGFGEVLVELRNTVLADDAPGTPPGDDNTSAPKSGFGSFRILSKVHGTGVHKVPADRTFRVAVDWTLPKGKTQADYPNWRAPHNPYYMTVHLNHSILFPEGGNRAFPVGTTVKMRNVAFNVVDPNLPSFKWGNVNWTVGNDTFLDEATYVITHKSPTLTMDTEAIDLDAKATEKVSVGDFVWWDKNANGIQDDGADSGLADVPVILTGPKVFLLSTKTKADGSYSFDNLPVLDAGQKYTVAVGTPRGFIPTKPQQGEDRTKDSSTTAAESTPLTKPGDSDTSLDFGFIKDTPDNAGQGDNPLFDTFTITSSMSGKTEQLSPDTKLRVAVHWTLPERTSPADYPNWTPPPNPTIMEVPANGEVAFPFGGIDAFPNTTEIVLEVLLDQTTPALPAGLSFGQPTWMTGDFVAPSNKLTTVVGSGNPIKLHTEILANGMAPNQPAPGDANKLGAGDANKPGAGVSPDANTVPTPSTGENAKATGEQVKAGTLSTQQATRPAHTRSGANDKSTLAATGIGAFEIAVLGSLTLIAGAGLLTLRRCRS